MKTNVNKKMLKLIFVVVMLDKLLVIMLVQNFGLRSFVVVDYSEERWMEIVVVVLSSIRKMNFFCPKNFIKSACTSHVIGLT